MLEQRVTSMIFTVPTLASFWGEVQDSGRANQAWQSVTTCGTPSIPSQASEYVQALQMPCPRLRSWSTGGENVPLELIVRLQQARGWSLPVGVTVQVE